MSLRLSKALGGFKTAEVVDLDCGDYDIAIRQVAFHNRNFRASVAGSMLAQKKKTLRRDPGTMTGSEDGDVKFYIEHIIVGWGARPMKDDDGMSIEPTPENFFEIFTSSPEGRVLFGKIQEASADEQLFQIREDDLKNL